MDTYLDVNVGHMAVTPQMIESAGPRARRGYFTMLTRPTNVLVYRCDAPVSAGSIVAVPVLDQVRLGCVVGQSNSATVEDVSARATIHSIISVRDDLTATASDPARSPRDAATDSHTRVTE